MPTTNNNWPTPVATDLVKDGWEAIKDLGDAIDTTLGVYVPSSSGLILLSTTSFSGVASQAVNNCFSSTYDNYRILLNIESSTGDTNKVTMRLRVSTTDTATGYTTQRTASTGGTVTSSADNLSTLAFYVCDSDKDQQGTSFAVIELLGPNEARKTNYLCNQGSFSGSSYFLQTISGNQTASTQFDGFNILNSVGNTTGTISVFGYAK